MQSKALTHRSLPIHIDNHLILPAFALFVTSSTLLYYYFSTEATRRAFEAARRRHLLQREKLASSEAKYASLRIHGQFANPFVEWRDTPWWETVLFWLGRIRGNSVPSNEEDLTSALPITKPSFDLLFPPAVSALDGPSRLPPSIRVFGTATPSLSESWVDAATVTASAPTSGIGIPPRIVFDPAPAPEQGPRMTYTWLGQSTSFVTMDGFNILTDPVFSPRVINSWFGPKRVRSLPCELKDLKRIDIVLVSHNHRDHLDEQVVRELNNTVTWYIPMGLRDWFVRRGVYNVIELDWWQEIHHKERQDIVIAAVPCMHWSGRCVPYDTNRSLWCSFVVKSQQHSFLHCGDTGYSQDLFKAIGEKYLPITVAALPVGGYEPQWYMRHMHMSPDDALAAHFALSQPRLTIGVRWGTFMLSNELYLDPPRRLVAAAEKLGVANEVQCIGLGKTVEIPEGEELEEDLDEEEMRARGAQGRRDTYEIERIVIELNAEGEALGWSTTEST